MTRLSSLFVATTLAILPLSAFAQQNTAPVEKTAPSSVTSATTPSVTDKVPSTATAHATQPNKSVVKSPTHEAASKEHRENTVKIHQTKEKMPVKTATPARS